MDPVDQNPLLQNFVFPPYDIVEPHHVYPAIESLLIVLDKELDELENNVEPTWPKLVVPLEKIVDRLTVVWRIVCHLGSVKDSPELRAVTAEIQPRKVEFKLRLRQSKPIYTAFRTIRDSPDWESLSDARKRVVELKLKEAVLNGISLEDSKRERFNEIEQELGNLGSKFEANLKDAIIATKQLRKLIDKIEIEGLVIAEKRAVLKEYASDMSSKNTPIIERILELRFEKANLLGHKNYAEVSFQKKMATLNKARDLIKILHDASWDHAIQDMEELINFARDNDDDDEIAEDMNYMDIKFWSAWLRESKYELNEEHVRQYFPLSRVLEGLFGLSRTLFDICIEPADGTAPVWDKDVKFYVVKDSTGATISYFYFDPYARPLEKRRGAWMDVVVGRTVVFSNDNTSARLPICHIICNFSPPAGNRPCLMTILEVEDVFHEFGHALQHMLTTENEGFVSGNRGIELDAIEIASQFMENWCYQRDTIMSFAKHYESGESLPEDLCDRILSSRTFRAGSQLLDQLHWSSVDLEIHSNYIPGGAESIYDIYEKIGKWTHVNPLRPENRLLCSFSHIFTGSYAAGYYSYQWAEVLSSDAFSAFEEAGLDDDQSVREMGKKFRDTFLALGGGKSPNEVFLLFRGREPSPDAFLRYKGLSHV